MCQTQDAGMMLHMGSNAIAYNAPQPKYEAAHAALYVHNNIMDLAPYAVVTYVILPRLDSMAW